MTPIYLKDFTYLLQLLFRVSETLCPSEVQIIEFLTFFTQTTPFRKPRFVPIHKVQLSIGPKSAYKRGLLALPGQPDLFFSITACSRADVCLLIGQTKKTRRQRMHFTDRPERNSFRTLEDNCCSNRAACRSFLG